MNILNYSGDFLDAEIYNYSNLNALKLMYYNFNYFENEHKKGHTAYSALYIDLKDALQNAGLNERQKNAILYRLINKFELKEVALHLDVCEETIQRDINSAMKKISKRLLK